MIGDIITVRKEIIAYHKDYSISCSRKNPRQLFYSNGEIISLDCTYSNDESDLTFLTKSGEKYEWKSKYVNVYNVGQFGIAVSPDGTKIFAQTWENGLFCFDVKTGERIWRTKSRRGVTSIFVNTDTITAQLHDYAMQLISMDTGEVIKEKRPSTAWKFTALSNGYLVCQTTAKKWEIIDPETLEVKESFSHKDFTGGNTSFCINSIKMDKNGMIVVSGFENLFDKYKHSVKSEFISSLKNE